MEQEKLKERIDSYVELLGEIKQKVESEEVAVRILGEAAKDIRAQAMRKERESANAEPASERQLSYLEDLKVKIPKHCTKEQASELIDEALARQNEESEMSEEAVSQRNEKEEESSSSLCREMRIPEYAVTVGSRNGRW